MSVENYKTTFCMESPFIIILYRHFHYCAIKINPKIIEINSITAPKPNNHEINIIKLKKNTHRHIEYQEVLWGQVF